MTEQTQDKQPLVSVVIPTYNRSKELARAIKSVLSQTYRNFEIIIVDDGSEEELKNVCDEFNDPRIKFLRNNKHTNANVARNRGIKEAQGEYIAMLDSDDEYLPDHLSRRIEKIIEWKCDGIFGSAYIDNGDEQILKLSRPLKKGELMINYLLSDGFAPTPSHFYKTSSAKEVLWDNSLLRHQDYDFSVRFAGKHNFLSDYEPTIVINWTKPQDGNKYHFTSCIDFINKHRIRITPPTYAVYTLSMLALSNNYKTNPRITLYYKKEIHNCIDFVTLAQYVTSIGTHNKYSKTIVILRYFFYLFKKKALSIFL